MPANSVGDALDVALMVARALDAIGATYFLGGSLASSLQGDPRSTNDIDFVISLPLDKLKAFREALGSDFEVDLDTLRDALVEHGSANIFFLPFVTKVDLFGLGREPYDASEFSRRRAVSVRETGETLIVKAPEDTVLRKLLWFRAGGEASGSQWRDVVSVLRVSGATMDIGYLDTWAHGLGLTVLLERARGEAGA